MALWVAGVDGCRKGWIAALAPVDLVELRVRVVERLEDLLDGPEQPGVVAIDIPIGLPERILGPGRSPEQQIRPRLGARRSSVFSIPSRAAVGAMSYPEACALARATSDPPRAVSKQAAMIFAKIRAVDRLLQSRPELVGRVYEVHPELAFWSLNGEQALARPKKARGRPCAAGLADRRALLIAAGLPPQIVDAVPPAGAGPDDLVDALAGLVVALKIAQGRGRSFPHPPDRDAFGLPMAIWTFEA